jgi:type III pantothenate kinase
MLLAIDIGNSSVKFGVFDGEDMVSRFAVATGDVRAANEIADLPAELADKRFEAVIVSSVAPELNPVLGEFAREHFGVEPVFVDHTFDLGITIKYDPPSATGIDRLVAASAAAAKYGAPCIVCDFGTAATIDAVNAAGEYLGGTIAPGINTLSRALFQNTSKLPEIPVRKPDKAIGSSTAGSIESGVFYGYIGLVEGILTRVKNEMPEDARVVATGGSVDLIAGESSMIDVVDKDLVLEGLRLIYSKIKDTHPK